MTTTEIYRIAEKHNGNVPLDEAISFAVKQRYEAVAELVHTPNEKPENGASVFIQTKGGAYVCGIYRKSELLGESVQVSINVAIPWKVVLRWVNPKEIM